MVTSRKIKVAWVRNADVPQGQREKGRLRCPCGNAPETDFNPANGDVVCACGTVYTWNGWIKETK